MTSLKNIQEQAMELFNSHIYPGLDGQLAAQGLKPILDSWKAAPVVKVERWALDSLDPDRKTVCFVANCPYYNLARVSSLLRRNGYQTVLLTLIDTTERYQQGYFDVMQDFGGNFLHLLTVLQDLSMDMAYVQGWHHNYHIPALVRFFLQASPVLCEFQDIVSFFLTKADYLDAWGLSPAAVELDFWSERYVLDHSAGCTFPYDETTRELLHDRYQCSSPSLSLPAYPTESFFASERTDTPASPPRLAFVGGIPATNYPDIVFSDAKMVNVLPRILGQGLSVDLYNNPILPDEMEIYYPEHLALTREFSAYRFFKGLPPAELKRVAPGYEYGLMLYDFTETVVLDEHLGHVLPSKFYAYLEMGLPVLVSKELRAVAALVREHGLGIVCSQSDIGILAGMLKRADWADMHANVLAYRMLIGEAHVAPRFLAFIDRIMAGVLKRSDIIRRSMDEEPLRLEKKDQRDYLNPIPGKGKT